MNTSSAILWLEGRKRNCPCRWRFEKDSVVVVTQGSHANDLEVLKAFEAGFVSEQAQESAKQMYEALLGALEHAVDGNDRNHALTQFTTSLSDERILFGVDLVQIPADCPLLQH